MGAVWVSACPRRRWLVVAAGVVMQAVLGVVMAWSVFRDPLAEAFGWTVPEITLAFTLNYLAFGALAFLVVFSFGGGLGVMPAFAAEYFGPTHVGSIFGLILTASGFGSVLGPLLMASSYQATGGYGPALWLLGAMALAGTAIPLFIRPPDRAGPAPALAIA